MRHRRHRRRSASLLLWGTLLVVALLGYLNANPIRLGHDEDLGPGRPERGRAGADVLVVGWPAEISRSADNGRFNEVDWSWVWVDVLAAQIGPVATCTPEELSTFDLDDYRFLVIGHSAMSHPEVSDAVLSLEQYVNRGGVLILERPQGSLREAFSADGRGGLRTPRAITSAAHTGGGLDEALQEMPLFTRYVGSTAPLAGAETLLAMDGAPVIYRLRRAAGTAITVDFNLGLAVLSLQQGRPTGEGFEVEPGSADGAPTVTDLIASPTLLDATVPYADLLSAVIVEIAMAEAAPLVAYWPYPDGVDGAVLLSHDVTAGDAHADWLATYAADLEATATFFFAQGSLPQPRSVDALREAGGEMAVLWERGDGPNYENRHFIGIGGLRPFYRQVTLQEHVEALSDAMGPGYEPRGVRTRDGLWSDTWTGTFQAMAVLGLMYDSSYGLSPGMDEALPAFRHGTGRPFSVFDENGLPFGLYEVPVVAPGLHTPEQLERFEALIRTSQQTLHQALGVRIAAGMFGRDDALARYDGWQWLFEQAAQRNHLVMDLGRFVEFSHERRLSGLTSRIVRPEDATGTDARVRLEIEANPNNGRLWLRVPHDIGETRFREAVVSRVSDTGAAPEVITETRTRSVEQLGVEYTLVELGEGPQQVEVSYR